MPIPSDFNPIGNSVNVLPPDFPLRVNVLTGRINGKTLGVNYEGYKVYEWSQYQTRYDDIAPGYDFKACVIVRGITEPLGSTLSVDVRKEGCAVRQVYATSTGIGSFDYDGQYNSKVDEGYGVNMMTKQSIGVQSSNLKNMTRDGDSVISTKTRFSVPTYSHCLLFDRELTKDEFVQVLSALQKIVK